MNYCAIPQTIHTIEKHRLRFERVGNALQSMTKIDGTDCEYERNNITVTISVPYSKVKETYQATNSIGMKHNKSLARTRTSLAVNYPIYPTDLVLHVLNILHQL